MTQLLTCCAAMKRAQEEGTDGEGYMEAISWDDYPEVGYQISAQLPPIQWCPWCGTKVDTKAQDISL